MRYRNTGEVLHTACTTHCLLQALAGVMCTNVHCLFCADDSRDALSQLNGMLRDAAGAEEAMIRCDSSNSRNYQGTQYAHCTGLFSDSCLTSISNIVMHLHTSSAPQLVFAICQLCSNFNLHAFLCCTGLRLLPSRQVLSVGAARHSAQQLLWASPAAQRCR